MSVLTVPTRTLPDPQRFIVALAADGMTDIEIAAQLRIRVRAVSRRMSQTLGELGADSRAGAVAEAYRRGWLQPMPCRRRGPALPPRQLEVLRLVVWGADDATICQLLTLGPRGLQKHLRLIYKRLNARNRAHAIRLAIDAGFVEVPR